MRRTITATLVAICFLSGVTLAATPPTETAVPAVTVSETVRSEAKVVAIDKKTRVVTLKNSAGKVFDVTAGDAVKNFAQIKPGDVVVTDFTQALAMKLKKSTGIRVTTEIADAKRAALGEKPAGAVGREINFVADVIGVDAKTGVVTLKGAKGKVVDLKVKDPQVLAEIKKGDQVEGTYVEALAIVVMPAKH